MGRRRPLVAIVAVLLVVVAAWRLTRAVPRPTHVVIVSLDTVRADHLGAYGHPRAVTPQLDAFAADSVRFAQATTAAPSTLASHTTLFTGLWPHTHGVPRNDHLVPDEAVLLQERLGAEGFQTAAFIGAIPIASHSRFTAGFEHVDERFTLDRRRDGVAQSMRPGDEVTDAVLAWLGAERDAERPLFLFVHYFDAHSPYEPEPRFRDLYTPDLGMPQPGSMRHIGRARNLIRHGMPQAEQHMQTLRDLYLGGISQVDHEVGRLMMGLDEAGLLDDALVVITSDHGESFDTHEELWDHGATVYDETIHVPLMVRPPRGWGGGRVVRDSVNHVDLVPTLVELLGLPLAEGETLDGVSWLPQLRGDWIRAARPPAFAEATKPHYRHAGVWQNDPLAKAIRHGGRKLIVEPRRRREALYDLRSDPDELTDLTPDVQAPDLRALMEAWRAAAKPFDSPRVSSARIKAELAALGYVEALEGDDDEAPDAPEGAQDDTADEQDDTDV